MVRERMLRKLSDDERGGPLGVAVEDGWRLAWTRNIPMRLWPRLRPGQRVGMFPKRGHLCSKDRFALNVQRMAAHGSFGA